MSGLKSSLAVEGESYDHLEGTGIQNIVLKLFLLNLSSPADIIRKVHAKLSHDVFLIVSC